MGPLLDNYDQIESKIKFLIEKAYASFTPEIVQHLCNIAMKTTIDQMWEVYDATIEHCAIIEPGAIIRNEIRELKGELINKLTK